MAEQETTVVASTTPGPTADPFHEIKAHLSREVLALYDVYSYRHAASVLQTSFAEHLGEIEEALLAFRLSTQDIARPGGNESLIPKFFSRELRPRHWHETRVRGDLIVHVTETTEERAATGQLRKHALPERPDIVLPDYIDGHRIDYVKGRVALDVEWNSKDQTYDRDLYAFRTFHECGVISVAVLITRSEKLDEVFANLPILDKQGQPVRKPGGSMRFCTEKYGASTTWMGKLIPRLNSGRNGGCPVLVFGITPKVVTDWPAQDGETHVCSS